MKWKFRRMCVGRRDCVKRIEEEGYCLWREEGIGMYVCGEVGEEGWCV